MTKGTTQPGGLLPGILIASLLTLVAAGVGFALGFLLQDFAEGKDNGITPSAGASAVVVDAKDASEAPPQGTEPSSDTTPSDGSDLKIVPIPPVLTTLAAPEGRWIRLEGSILVKTSGTASGDLLAERAGEQILTYLRTVALEQIQGTTGFLALRDDINETVRSLSGGEIHEVLIHGFLIE